MLGVLVLGLPALAGPAAAQTETEDYAAAVAQLEARAAVLVTDVESVNANWDNEQATFDVTLEEMGRIETETAAIVAELDTLVPPEGLEGQHSVMQQTAAAMSAAATDMTAGLRGADSGEGRQAAAVAYVAAAADFSDLALLVQGGAEPTTTTTTTAAASTTSVVATTVTTLPVVTTTPVATTLPEPVPAEDGSGAPWVLLPVVMVLGIALGIVAGLLIGKRARVEQIETIRRLREGGPAPPTD
jgi:hypothetical protein